MTSKMECKVLPFFKEIYTKIALISLLTRVNCGIVRTAGIGIGRASKLTRTTYNARKNPILP